MLCLPQRGEPLSIFMGGPPKDVGGGKRRNNFFPSKESIVKSEGKYLSGVPLKKKERYVGKQNFSRKREKSRSVLREGKRDEKIILP